jgi:hypothetical protein
VLRRALFLRLSKVFAEPEVHDHVVDQVGDRVAVLENLLGIDAAVWYLAVATLRRPKPGPRRPPMPQEPPGALWSALEQAGGLMPSTVLRSPFAPRV